jgi:hypothetical protein
MCLDWLAFHRDRDGQRVLGEVEGWPETLGGILAAAGFDGFLTGRDALYERADDDLDADR